MDRFFVSDNLFGARFAILQFVNFKNVMDAALIACAQKIEHYEIATYGTLCTWAEQLGYSDALELLTQNMDDEKNADMLLTELSKTINPAALP